MRSIDFKKLGYYGERHREAMEDAQELNDTQYLTPSTLAFVKKDPLTGFHKIVSEVKTCEPDKSGEISEKPTLGKAVLNFDNYLAGICGETRKDQMEFVFEGLDFDQSFEMVKDEIQKIYDITISFKNRIFFLRRGIEELTKSAGDIYSSSLNYLLTEFVNFESGDVEEFNETLGRVKDIHIKALRAVGAKAERLEEIEKCFEYLNVLYTERKTAPDKEQQLDEVISLLNDLYGVFQDIFIEVLGDFAEVFDKDFEDIAWATFSIQSDCQDLSRCLGLKFEEYENAFLELRKACSERDLIYGTYLGHRAENKALILSGLNRLFVLASSAQEIEKIGGLINKIEPKNDNNCPMKIETVPESFFSEAEIRALRLYFAHVELGIPKAEESFLLRELQELIKVQKETEHYATALEINSNRLLLRLERSDLSDEIKEYLFRKLMDTEYGLVVRDKTTGFSISSFETERYKEGDKWFYRQTGRRVNPNFEANLRPHSQNPDGVFDIRKREFEIKDKEELIRYRNFEKYVGSSPSDAEDLEMALIDEPKIEDIKIEGKSFDDLLNEIRSLTISCEKEGVDNRQKILEVFLEIYKKLKKENEKRRAKTEVSQNLFDLDFGRINSMNRFTDFLRDLSEEHKIQVYKALDEYIGSVKKIKESLSILEGLFNDEEISKQFQKIKKKLGLQVSKIRGFKKDFSALVKKVKNYTLNEMDMREFYGKLAGADYDHNLIKDYCSVIFNHTQVLSLSKDQIEKLFDSIENLLGLSGLFSEIDVRALSFMYLSQIIPFEKLDESGIFSDFLADDFQYDRFYSATLARKRYEELLSSILPNLDKMKDYVAKSDSIDEAKKALITEQLELSEWGISGRVLATNKPTLEDKFLMDIRNGAEEKLQEIEAETQRLEALKIEEMQPSVESEESDEEIYEKAGLFNFDKVLFRYAIPSSIVALTLSLVALVMKEQKESYESDSDENVLIASVENPTQADSEKSELEKKYDSGEIIYGSSDANDKFGYQLLSKVWEGIETEEEAENYYKSLDLDSRRNLNQILKATISEEEITKNK